MCVFVKNQGWFYINESIAGETGQDQRLCLDCCPFQSEINRGAGRPVSIQHWASHPGQHYREKCFCFPSRSKVPLNSTPGNHPSDIMINMSQCQHIQSWPLNGTSQFHHCGHLHLKQWVIQLKAKFSRESHLEPLTNPKQTSKFDFVPITDVIRSKWGINQLFFECLLLLLYLSMLVNLNFRNWKSTCSRSEGLLHAEASEGGPCQLWEVSPPVREWQEVRPDW